MTDRIAKVVLRGDVSGLKSSMTVASKSVQDVADRMTKADKNSARFRQGLTTLGDSAAKLGLVAGAGLGAVVVATANFDQAMSSVQAATHESADAMSTLRDAAIQAGADTAFSASEAAGGIENLAKAGISTRDILKGGLAGSLDLAAAGGLDVAEAAETAATALTQFKLKGSDVPHVADLLAAGAGKAQGDVSDLGMALRQSGLVASQMGLSIEDTTGALSAFASAGLLGSDAGTSFKSMLQRLANPLGKGADAMDRLGINAYDAQGDFVGITDLAGQLRTKLGGLTQAQRDAAMAQIFGSDAVRAASVLYQQGSKGIQSWIDKTDDAGYAAETAATRLDNFRGDLEALGGSLETALIGSGEGSTGILRELTQDATAAVNVFNKMPGPLKSSATGMLAITAVTGGGLWFTAKTVNGITSMRGALENLGVSSRITGRALKGVGLAAGGLTAVQIGYSAISQLNKAIDESLPGVQRLTGQLIELSDATSAARLSSEFDDLGSSIDRIADGRWDDTLESIVSFGQLEAKSLREARAEVDALDAAFANLVTSGSPDVAADALDRLAASQGLTSGQMKDLLALMPQYKEALAGQKNEADLSTDATKGLTGATGKNTDATAANTDAQKDNLEAMREKRAATIGAANAEIGYQASIDDARTALKKNGKNLDITTEKGRANKTALIAMAGAWNQQSDAIKSGKGNRREAIHNFVDMAHKMGMGRDKAKKLADKLFELGKIKTNPKVNVDTSGARHDLKSLHDWWKGMDWSVVAKVITAQTTKHQRLDAMYNASGSIVDYYGSGGVRERHVAQIAPAGAMRVWAEPETGGEAYIPLAHHKQPRSRAIADEVVNRLGGQTQWYADGGIGEQQRRQMAAQTATARSTAPIDYDRLAAALDDRRGRSAPLIGQATIAPHSYSEFTRQMQETARLDSAGGADFR